MKQPLIVILILLILGLGFGYIFVWPNYQRWDSKKNELASITTELEDLAAKQSFIKQLEDAEPTLSQMSEQALAFIPVEEEREQFASELDSLAQANGLSLTTLTFSVESAPKAKAAVATNEDGADAAPAAPAAGAAKATAKGGLNYNAAIVGNYQSIEKFLKQLYQTKRYTTIKTFEVTMTAQVTSSADPAAAPGEPLINLTISGSILNKPLNKKFAKDQKFSTDIWKFLVDRTTTVPTTSAANPFAPF